MKSSESITILESGQSAERRPAVTKKPTFAAVRARLEMIADSRWFAYGSILLIQAKLLWGIWLYRDLTNGDTASYYRSASLWASDLQIEWAFSPLYNIFYGSLKWLVPDAYDVTILHRVIIVVAASLLVLAVLRRLLPPGIAWVMALWWTLLPINYDIVYEVHLFAVLPTLLAVLVALHFSGFYMRAAVLAILVVSGTLVRTEIIVAAVAWAAVWIGYEVWTRRRTLLAVPRAKALAAVAIPVALAAIYFGPASPGDEAVANKGSLVVCQGYAHGARQRGEYQTELTSNQPLACRGLMQEVFGQPFPSWSQAVRANPGAIAEHLAWNAGLIPHGVELMLFDQTSGSPNRNPDFVPATTGSPAALVGLLVVVAFVIAGLTLLWRQRRQWWEAWLRDRAWGWAVLGCLAVAAVVVMLTIRPRPSYLFNFSVLLLAVIGMCGFVLGSRWPALARLRAVLPVVAAGILLGVPSIYDARYQTPQAGASRPLLEMVDRMEPFEEVIGTPTTRLLTARFADEACAYLAPETPCRGVSLLEAIKERPKGTTLPDILKQLDTNVIYADESVITNPSTRDLLQKLEAKGWEPLGPSPSSGESWTLLQSPRVPLGGSS